MLFAHEDFLFEDDYRDPVKRFGVVATFIKRLSREQNYRGGFAFWSSSLESPTLTLMVAEFLIEAREAGHEVDALLEKTKGHILNTYLRDDAYDLREFNKEYRDKLKIHALYVLHKLGQPQPSRYGDFRHNLFEKDKVSQLRLIEMLAEDEQYQPLVQAWLKEQNNLIRLKGETAVVDDPKVALDGYYFGYSSRAQTARLARLLINVEPSHPLLFPLLMGLTQEKSNRQYISSLETLEVLQALKAYQKVLVAGREPVIATIRMNDRELLGRIDPKKNNQPIELPLKTLPDRMNLQIVKDSGDVLFYDMKFHYALKEFRDWGLEQGITLTREYFDLKGIAVTPKDFLHGKTYKVVLNFFFADEADFLVVEEPLAAGVEPVNFALQTSRWGLQRQVTNTQPTLGAYLDHREFRDKKILLFAGFVPRGFYEFTYFINVTNRGQFMTPPAKAMEMYSPEIFGTTGKEEVRVK
ncbi:MAG: hypothetical protein ACD_62C00446G0003 [uncultured bacterium]|nr:MAG: hypothetical protein ACD_62C00446G0003 [uncultured bacterium]